MTLPQNEMLRPDGTLTDAALSSLLPHAVKEKTLQEKLAEEILLVGLYGPHQIDLSVSKASIQLLEKTDKRELSNAVAILLGFEKPFGEAASSAIEEKYQHDLPQVFGENLAFSIRIEEGRVVVDRGEYYSRPLKKLDAVERSSLFYDILDELGCPTP